jgi:hypothetical protein
MSQELALPRKSWQRSNFGSFLGVKRRFERVDVMPALDHNRPGLDVPPAMQQFPQHCVPELLSLERLRKSRDRGHV